MRFLALRATAVALTVAFAAPAARSAPVETPPQLAAEFTLPAASPEAPDTRPVIAVVKLTNGTRDLSLDQVTEQMATALLTIAGFRDRYRLVDRAHIQDVLKEIAFGQTGLPDARTTKQLGQILNASQLLVGTIRPEPEERVTISISLLDAATAEQREGVTVANIPRAELNQGIECLALNIAVRMKVPVPDARLIELNERFQPQWAGGVPLLAIIGGVALLGIGIALLVGGRSVTPTPPPGNVRFGF